MESSSEKKSTYIHGTSQVEQSRLSMLNSLLNRHSLEKMKLRGNEKILDVGSGLGQFSRVMGKVVSGKGSVLGIERDIDQINSAIRYAEADGEASLVEFRQGDALNLPLRKEEWSSFDLVHARFLLEHLTQPEKAVEEMVKACKPGGRIILEDDDHFTCRAYPEPPGFQALWFAYCRSYDRIGNDPYIGQRLVSLLYNAGAKNIKNDLFFFGNCAGNETFEAYALNLIGVIEGAKDLIIKERLMDKNTFEQSINILHKWRTKPDAALWYSVCWAQGVK
jgi:ubiquinone/menaquinone biosynthesis C-methylase UbiE